MPQWVSFADLKRQVSIEDVLAHYGLLAGLRQRRDELVGPYITRIASLCSKAGQSCGLLGKHRGKREPFDAEVSLSP